MRAWSRRRFGSGLLVLVGFARGRPGRAAAMSPPAVGEAWSRPALRGRTGVVYMTITGSSRDDALVGVQAGVASRVELHRSFDDSGVMRMRPVERIAVPAGAVVRLAPDGYHAMLVGLREDLVAGRSFPIVLMFEAAGAVQADAAVRPRAAAAEGMGDGMAMPMPIGPPDRP